MFSKYIHKRINIVFIVVILCFALIIGKVLFIEVFSYNKLNDYANNLWSRNLPIMADRGIIKTSDNVIVADNLTTVSLVFIPNQIKLEKKEEIASNIANILGCNINAIKEHISSETKVTIPR